MVNLMTLGHPDTGDNKNPWLPRMRVLNMALAGMPDYERVIWTWGWVLIDDPDQPLPKGISEFVGRQDAALKNVIARCMADDPANRPTLYQLLDLINRGIRMADGRGQTASRVRRPDTFNPPRFESDALIDRFYQEYFREPRVPHDPYAPYWEGGTPVPKDPFPRLKRRVPAAPGGLEAALAEAAQTELAPPPAMPGTWPSGQPLNMQYARAMDIRGLDAQGANQDENGEEMPIRKRARLR